MAAAAPLPTEAPATQTAETHAAAALAWAPPVRSGFDRWLVLLLRPASPPVSLAGAERSRLANLWNKAPISSVPRARPGAARSKWQQYSVH